MKVDSCPVEGCDWPDGRWGPKYDCGLRRLRSLGVDVPNGSARELGCGYARRTINEGEQ